MPPPSALGNETALVEPARAGDEGWFARVDPHASAALRAETLADGRYLLARIGDDPVGFLRWSLFWGIVPYLELIWVASEHRSVGMGRRLLAAWEHRMRRRGAAVLMTSAMSDEEAPQRWHARQGFRPSGSLTFGSVQPTPECFFIKQL